MNKKELLAKELKGVTEELKVMESKAKIIKEALLEELLAEGEDSFESSFGKASVARRKTYEYTEEVLKAQEQVDMLKIEEQEKGLAEMSVTEYLVFKIK